MTVIAMAMALSITGLAVWLLDAAQPGLVLSIAFACPILIAPPISYYYFRQTELLDKLVKQLNEAHSSLKSAYEKMEEQARLDGLTGLLNRGAFIASAERLIAGEQEGAILLLDIDHFKSINDTWGHAAGDTVLASTAACIRDTLDRDAIIGRLGGEEFGILLPGVSPRQGYDLAERVRLAVRHRVKMPQEATGALTISIGCARIGGAPFQRSFEEADANLYRAKRGGRNQTSGLWRAA